MKYNCSTLFIGATADLCIHGLREVHGMKRRLRLRTRDGRELVQITAEDGIEPPGRMSDLHVHTAPAGNYRPIWSRDLLQRCRTNKLYQTNK